MRYGGRRQRLDASLRVAELNSLRRREGLQAGDVRFRSDEVRRLRRRARLERGDLDVVNGYSGFERRGAEFQVRDLCLGRVNFGLLRRYEALKGRGAIPSAVTSGATRLSASKALTQVRLGPTWSWKAAFVAADSSARSTFCVQGPTNRKLASTTPMSPRAAMMRSLEMWSVYKAS